MEYTKNLERLVPGEDSDPEDKGTWYYDTGYEEELKVDRSWWPIVRFEDKYQQRCSLQESSIATEACIWLGVDNLGPHLKTDNNEKDVSIRMHLTQTQVQALLPFLMEFAETGYIEAPPSPTERAIIKDVDPEE